ncbi:MAG: cellulase family glycosylhydrolase [Deltaproteobacteria bacterium]|nr:cellulase family glycosylhydrolase [Deltaproteobacteria bacterium]MBN2672501.1 cellulase family glycosylhydrolase [Deltaproteobacteria bacterium]
MNRNVLQILISACLFIFSAAASAAPEGFVTAEGTRLKLNGEDFYFSGANTYSMLYSELDAEEQMQIAEDLGLNALRIWGFWNGEDLNPQIEDGRVVRPGTPDTDIWGHYVLQSRPRVYPEQAWRRLDYAIYLANIYGIKLIIPMLNEWPEFGGLDTMMNWATDLPEAEAELIADLVANRKNLGNNEYENAVKQMRYLFWESQDCRNIYFDYVRRMLNRVNMYTGVAYKDDPAIMIWEVMNEPRFGPWGGDPSARVIHDFLKESSELIKSIDPHHLVGTGEEGFFRPGEVNNLRTTYPWTGANGEGVSWVLNSQIETIDVLSFHSWPFQWSLWDQSQTDGGDFDARGEYPDLTDFGPEWVQGHIDAINNPEFDIAKPIYLGEFGYQILRQDETDPEARSTVSYRNELMRKTYEAVMHEDVAGVAYWSMTASHDVDYVTYKGPIERNNLLQAYFTDDATPHDLDFYFDIFCPEDVTTCAMIEEFTAQKIANNVNNPPFVEPCLEPKTQCGNEGDMETCVFLDTHPDHCGACNNVCAATQACSFGECIALSDLQADDEEGDVECRYQAASANASNSIFTLLF